MIYVDMDGVLSDFDGIVHRLYGKPMEQMLEGEAEDFWRRDCVSERVFAKAQPIDGGISLLEWLMSREIDVCVLTSTGGGCMHHNIMEQKIEWLHRHVSNNVPVAFCLNTRSKASFAAPGHMLIDDRQKVVDAFCAAGGSAQLFKPGEWLETARRAQEFYRATSKVWSVK
jgi:beta-phosphoglucomutase-like phosphatase (HAD superfamily)